jgi:hypothetical protein
MTAAPAWHVMHLAVATMSSCRLQRWPRLLSLFSLLAALSACSPPYNWREVHGDKLRFSVLLPAKPVSFSRQINLDGMVLEMTMTAAEVDSVSYAVGVAELDDAGQAPQALAAMRTALLNNIAGVTQNAALPGRADGAVDVVATGVVHSRAQRLMARLLARDKRIYQVLILGPANAITAERADMFFTSFMPA